MLFKLSEQTEYIHAVVDAATDPVSPLLRDQQKPELITSIRLMLDAAIAAIKTLSDRAAAGEIQEGGEQLGDGRVLYRKARLLESTD